MADITTIKVKRYVNGAILDAAYQCSETDDDYLYFNDDVHFRKSIKTGHFEVQNECGAWIITNMIWDGSQTSFNTQGATAVSENADVEAAVLWALQIADDPAHGYDQPTRDGGVDYDCSSFVSTAFRQAGFAIPLPSPSTYSMIAAFTAAGFTWMPGYGYDFQQLQRGDILLFVGDQMAGTGHTALYVGSGQMVEALINEFGGTSYGEPGDQGNEIICHSWWDSNWNGILRYES